MRTRLVPLVFIASTLLAGCGSDQTKSGAGSCGNGTAEEHAGETHCLFDKNRVVEAAFVCPSESPSRYTNSGSDCIVCSPDPELSNAALSVICDDWGDEGPLDDAGTSDADAGTSDSDASSNEDSGATDDAGACEPTTIPGDCDHFCQTGCPENQVCTLGGATSIATGCTPAGPATQDEVCDNTQRCAAGYICLLNQTGGSVGTCLKFCRIGDGRPQCDDGQVCQQIPNTDSGICRTT